MNTKPKSRWVVPTIKEKDVTAFMGKRLTLEEILAREQAKEKPTRKKRA